MPAGLSHSVDMAGCAYIYTTQLNPEDRYLWELSFATTDALLSSALTNALLAIPWDAAWVYETAHDVLGPANPDRIFRQDGHSHWKPEDIDRRVAGSCHAVRSFCPTPA
jgi:hypothetical protein